MCIRDREYAPQTLEEAWNPLFVEALQKKPYTEYLLDILLSDSMEAVSYTHLDVYKRQIKARITRLYRWSKAETEKPQTQDVYKRQVSYMRGNFYRKLPLQS